MESLWTQTTKWPERESLSSNKNYERVHTVVIGAGMAGILTAYLLQKAGQNVIVLEAKRLADGQTKNTTAKITSQHDLFYEKLIRKTGKKRAKAYAAANEAAIWAYEKMIKEEQIACHFKKLPSYLYTKEEKGKIQLKKEAEAAAALGITAHYIEGEAITELPYKVHAAVCFENQAQFHPLEFMKAVAKKLTIYEDTKVLSVKGHILSTNKGNIYAENIVFATHYPFVNVPGFYFLRQHQERSYVLALEGIKELSGMYYSIDKGGLSFRSAEDNLLIGGGNHRTGKCLCKEQQTGYAYLKKIAQTYYPNAKEAAAWAAQDCMPHDEIPFIGRYSVLRPYWYVATGFKKWGMTSAMIAANIISSQICGITTEYEHAFTPQRFLVRASIKNLLIDIGESIMGLGKGLFSSKRHRCPHMGCRLEWNAKEQSWDCPCHGSRFDKEGELQDNPAQIDIR